MTTRRQARVTTKITRRGVPDEADDEELDTNESDCLRSPIADVTPLRTYNKSRANFTDADVHEADRKLALLHAELARCAPPHVEYESDNEQEPPNVVPAVEQVSKVARLPDHVARGPDPTNDKVWKLGRRLVLEQNKLLRARNKFLADIAKKD